MADTVMDVLERTAKKHGKLPAQRAKRNGVWEEITWKEYRDQVRLAARGFMALGLESGQGVSIIGFNCPQWVLSEIGAIYAGGVPAGIYTTSSPEQCQYITDHCDASIAVVENVDQLAKFKKVRKNLPKLKAIVMMHGNDDAKYVHSWDELLAMGKKVPESDLEKRIKAQKPDDTCTLIYTSGTTGMPKGVMLTHSNITWSTAAVAKMVKGSTDDRFISYLPLSHVAEQIVSVHGPIHLGACVSFAEGMDQLGDNLKEVRPTIFLAVPRVWEKIQGKIVAAGANNPWMKKKIAGWARKKGIEGGYAEQNGRPKPYLYKIANRLVFTKVREKLGLDRCRIQLTGAAPPSMDTLEFFLSLGIPMHEVYGMSECCGAATVSLPDKYRLGKVGTVVPGTEVKIAEDGEICMRGPHVFKGYLKNEEATRATIDKDGWLHSGDIGELDDEGFLKITDRKKDIIITSGGENIAPQLIEGYLKAIPAVAQAFVVGDKRKYLAAIITLDPEQIGKEAEKAGSKARTVAEASKCEKFRAYINQQVEERVNKHLARVQTVKKFAIIPGDFTIDGGELTPTMKMKRKVISDKYAREIEELYR